MMGENPYILFLLNWQFIYQAARVTERKRL